MKIILSPAKKMITDTDSIAPDGLPEFIEKTTEIQSWLKSKSKEELKTIWKCNDKITEQNFNRLENMDLYHLLTPAVLSYEGIAFQYMAPSVFEDSQFEYVQNHLRIISAFYGVLKPRDGVTPYRLEMQAKVGIGETKNLYEYWGDLLYRSVIDNSRIIINLASKEYSKCIEKYLTRQDRYITITFYELSGDNSLFICAVSLNSDEQAYVVKEYVSEYNYYERVSLYPIEDKIYVNWLSGVSADKSLYYIEQIDISTDNVSRLCDMNEKYPEISSTIINWNSETYFDKDGNLYFTCVDKDNYMVKKLNVSTGDIKDLYVQELQHEKDYGYVHLKNYDGNYIYIYKGVNLMALSGKPLDEQFKKYDNYIYILDTDGNIKDTVILNNTDEKVSGNISAEFYGGDERCLLIGFSTHDIKGLELSEEEQNLRIKLEDEVFKNKKGFVDVNVSAILDKSQIGSGNITLEPVTPE